jgi:catalase
MQSVPERIIARQLVHFYKADPNYGRGVAAKLGIDMERFIPWTKLSLAKLIEKTAQ